MGQAMKEAGATSYGTITEHKFAAWYHSQKEWALKLRTADSKYLEEETASRLKEKSKDGDDDDEDGDGDEKADDDEEGGGMSEEEQYSLARRALDMFDVVDTDDSGHIDLEELRTVRGCSAP